MSTQNKYMQDKEKSSVKVAKFLEKNNLHKKDFAQMIGVTLSYVYNLIDEAIPFSSRGTTLERIATVMGILPEEFEEYLIQEEPIPFNPILQKIKDRIRKNKISALEFIKFFERKKRLFIVDMLRGVEPVPIDYEDINQLCEAIGMNKKEIFNLWKDRMIEHLRANGFDVERNKGLIDTMFKCAENYTNATT